MINEKLLPDSEMGGSLALWKSANLKLSAANNIKNNKENKWEDP